MRHLKGALARLGLGVGCVAAAFGGQSLAPGTTPGGAGNLPLRGSNDAYTIEIGLHNVQSNTPGAFLFRDNSVDMAIRWDGGTGTTFWVGAVNGNDGGNICIVNFGNYPNGMAMRIQRSVVNGAALLQVEAWSLNGGNRSLCTITNGINSAPTFNWMELLGVGDKARIAFLRRKTGTVALNTRPPLPADPAEGNVYDYKFDGTLADASGNGRTMGMPGATFVSSPPPVVVASFQAGSPSSYYAAWTDTIPCRAGYPCELVSGAYQTGDTSPEPSAITWQQVDGPTSLQFSSRSAATVTVNGCVFGQYTIRLVATGDNGATGTKDLAVGCVATDDKGIVIHADPRVDTFLGPMIAFGRNPWTWMDERHYTGAALRSADYDARWAPGFATWQPGTVSWDRQYTCSTALAAGIGPGDTTITVADASGCNWSTLPTVIRVGSLANLYEENVMICNRSGNTLTVCPYGRGIYYGPKAYGAGTQVTQHRVEGTGTAFLTSVCGGGAVSPGGTFYESGTVTVTNGSATITRASGGANWNAGVVNKRIRIVDGGGHPYFGGIGSVTNGTTAALYGAWQGPSGTYSYTMQNLDRAFLALEWDDPDLLTNPPAPNGNTLPWGLVACTSDTVAYVADRTNDSFGTGAVAGKRYAYHKETWFNGGGFGPNYYDEVLGHYALYFRSGLQMPLDTARKLSRYWMKNPEFAGGRTGSPDRATAEAGAFLAAVLDGQAEDWPILRKRVPVNRDVYPCNRDLRETSYADSRLALAALFDPDPAQRAVWKAELAKMYTRDSSETCRGTDGSYPVTDGYLNVDYAGVDLTATNGSRDVTGTGIPPSVCNTAASGGEGSISNGATALTAQGLTAGGGYIFISGTRSGAPWYQIETFRYLSPTLVTLSQPWEGDSCSANCRWYVINAQLGYLAAGTLYDRTAYTFANPDPALALAYPNHACEWVSPGLIRLDRPWTGTTGNKYRWSMNNLSGKGTQIYMAGIKAFAMNYAAQIDDAGLAANYRTLVRNLGTYILNQGFDDVTGGIYYARGFDACEPARAGTLTRSNCGPDKNLNGEVLAALRVAYEADEALRGKIDRAYGATFGKPGWTRGSVTESAVDLTFPLDANFAYKYYGLFFGISLAHQWPATRLGGVQAPAPQQIAVNFDLGSVAQAADVKVVVTAPSGAVQEFVCTATPCAVTVDRRQGDHWVRIEYRDGTGRVLARGEPELWNVRQLGQ